MPAVTLVVGDEELLVARAVEQAIRAARADPAAGEPATGAPSADDIVVHDVIASELSPAELAEMASPSLFAEARVVVVQAAQDASKELTAALVALAEAGETTLVVVHAGGVKGKAVLEAMRGAGATVVEAPRVKSGRDREDFVLAEARLFGGEIERDAAADLVASIGTDLRELSTACRQLVADVGPRVSREAVAAYYRGRAESTGFAVADRAVEGDVAAALETLRWAFATGTDPVLVSAALAANLRTIALVGAAGRGSPDSLAGPLGMQAWKIRRAQGWLKRWRPDALARATQAVADADAGIKGEGADASYAAEKAVILVAECVAR